MIRLSIVWATPPRCMLPRPQATCKILQYDRKQCYSAYGSLEDDIVHKVLKELSNDNIYLISFYYSIFALFYV